MKHKHKLYLFSCGIHDEQIATGTTKGGAGKREYAEGLFDLTKQ